MKPLSGVKVVEMSTQFAGPSVGRILADWGADVIKVEAPQGDPLRFSYIVQQTPMFEEGCPTFDAENSNKRFVCLDLKLPEGKEAMMKLLEQTDVFITNTRTKALEKLGFGYDLVAAKNPKIVYAEVLGYGAEGPLKDMPGYDYTVFFARSGLMADFTQEGKDVINLIAGFGDHVSAISTASGICAALYRSQVSGMGERVTNSLYQSAIYLLATGLLNSYFGRKYPCTREESNSSPLLQTYKCKDGEWILLCMPQYARMWPIVCEKVLDRPDLATDPRFIDYKACVANSGAAIGTVSDILATQDSAYWLERMVANDIAHEKLAHFRDVLKDEQAWANNYFIEYTYPNGEKAVFAQTPVTFGSIPEMPFKHGKRLGGDTADVLANLGYSAEQIKELSDKGAIVV